MRPRARGPAVSPGRALRPGPRGWRLVGLSASWTPDRARGSALEPGQGRGARAPAGLLSREARRRGQEEQPAVSPCDGEAQPRNLCRYSETGTETWRVRDRGRGAPRRPLLSPARLAQRGFPRPETAQTVLPCALRSSSSFLRSPRTRSWETWSP